MADSIGNWAVTLSANATGLVSGLDASSQAVQQFAKKAIATTNSVASSVNSALRTITKVDLGQQASQLTAMAGAAAKFALSAATGNVFGMVAAAGSSLVAFTSFVTTGLEAIEVQERLGKKVNVTAQEVAGLRVLGSKLNVNPEALSEGLDKWVVQLGKLKAELQQGGGAMTTALSHMGINAGEFSRASLPEQFAQIAEHSQAITDPLARSAALTTLLTRRNMDLIPLFRAQASDLRDLSGLASQYGINISSADASKAAASMRSMKEIGGQVSMMFSGIGQGFAVGFAGGVQYGADVLKRLVVAGAPIVELGGKAVAMWALFSSGLWAIVPIIDFFMPLIEGWGAIFKEVGDGIGEVFTEIWEILKEFGGAFAELFGGEMSNPLNSTKEMMVDFSKVIRVVFKMGVSLIREFAQATASALSAITTTIDWVKTFATFGLSAGEATQRAQSFQDALARIAAGPARELNLNMADEMLRSSFSPGELAAVRAEMDQQGVAATELMNVLRRMRNEQMAAQEATAVSNINPMFGASATMGQQISDLARLQQNLRGQVAVPEGTDAAAEINQASVALRNEIAEMGLSANAIQQLRLIRNGATQEQLAGLAALQSARDAGRVVQDASALQSRLVDQHNTMGMTSTQAELFRLRQRGATEEVLRGAQAMADQIERTEQMNRMRQEGRQVTEANRTPVEAFQEQVNRLGVLMAEGVLDGTQFDRGVMRAFGTLDQAFQQQQHTPQAAMAGTVDAARIIAQQQRDEQRSGRDPMDRMRAILEQQRNRQDTQIEQMRELLQVARDGFFDVIE